MKNIVQPQSRKQSGYESARNRAFHAIGAEVPQLRPLTSASLGVVAGVPLEEIGLLRDVRLRLSTREEAQRDPTIEHYMRCLRSFRREFNSLSISKEAQVETAQLARILMRLENELSLDHAKRADRELLRAAFRHTAITLRTANRYISFECAREVAVYILGKALDVLSSSKDESRTAVDLEPPIQNTDSPRVSAPQLRRLEEFLKHRGSSKDLGSSLPVDISCDVNKSSQVVDISRAGSGELDCNDTLVPPRAVLYPRTAPVHFVTASRRALLGVKIAAAHGLSDSISAFRASSTVDTLQEVSRALSLWRTGEGLPLYSMESVADVGGREEVDNPTGRLFVRNLFSAPGASHQSILRDTAAVAVRWTISRYQVLSDSDKLKAFAELNTLLSSVFEALHALTAREMIETLAVVSFPKEDDDQKLCNKWRVKRAFPGAKQLETGRVGYLLGVNEANPLDCRFGMKKPPHISVKVLSDTLRQAPRDRGSDNSAKRRVQRELKHLEKLASWAERVESVLARNTPKIGQESAIWISEYDKGDGVTLPKQAEQYFEEIQREQQRPAESKESGLVNPESKEWLRRSIDAHDGFLLLLNEGDPRKPLLRAEPEALLVTTCSQTSKSPLLGELVAAAQNFLHALPSANVDTMSVVLAELVVISKEGSGFVREYGEAPLEMLIRQMEFNIVNRFPDNERIEVLGMCRENSPAMKAYQRYGYCDTGAMYTDGHGTEFHIIHKSLFPADIVLGLRDL